MRSAIRSTLVMLVVACGGKAATPAAVAPPAPKPDPIPVTAGPACTAMARHIVEIDGTQDGADELASRVAQRCESDRWSDAARSCFNTATTDDEFEGCAAQLSDAQREGLAGAVGEGPPAASAPPPPPAPRGGTRGGAPAGADPCEGGE